MPPKLSLPSLVIGFSCLLAVVLWWLGQREVDMARSHFISSLGLLWCTLAHNSGPEWDAGTDGMPGLSLHGKGGNKGWIPCLRGLLGAGMFIWALIVIWGLG